MLNISYLTQYLLKSGIFNVDLVRSHFVLGHPKIVFERILSNIVSAKMRQNYLKFIHFKLRDNSLSVEGKFNI